MPQKTIKTSELVHSELEARKEEQDSFDDVLRDLLDLTPDLDDMVAYFDEDLQEASKDLVSHIDEQGDFEWKIREGSPDELMFRSDHTTIAKATFSEHSMNVYYRTQDGSLDSITGLTTNNDGEVKCRLGGHKHPPETAFERVEDNIPGAYRRWG